jgi:lipopolysaccharide biosynthesis glycosyltransferase
MRPLLFISCDDHYLPFACVTAKMAIEHRGAPFDVAIVHDRAAPRNVAAGKDYLGQRAFFVDGSPHLDNLHLRISGYITRATYLRLFIDALPEFREFDKVVYADCDVQILADLNRLFAVPHNAPLIAAYDLRHLVNLGHRDYLPMAPDAAYFNAGVISMELDWIRREGYLARAREFAITKADLCMTHDQDALNVVFYNNWQTLDWRWNVGSAYLEYLPDRTAFARHFTGKKPWAKHRHYIGPDEVRTYRDLLRNSPWPERFVELGMGRQAYTALRTAAKTVEMQLKRACAVVGVPSRKARRVRRQQLILKIDKVLSRIESDAAEGRLARPYPETSLLA